MTAGESSAGRRVLVTGGAGGLGRAIAAAFAAAGERVHVADRDAAACDQVTASSAAISATVADVSAPADVDRVFADVITRLGGLDVLVNNVGISGPVGPIEDLDPAEWRRTLEVNVDAHFLCTARAIPLLIESDAGSIVNIASTAGIMGYPHRSPYAASKFAVVGLTKTLAMELGDRGIRVNAVCPGPIAGERMERVIEAEAAAGGRTPEDVRRGYATQTSLGSFIDAADVVAAVLFLSSPAAARITGQVIGVDGNTETLRTAR